MTDQDFADIYADLVSYDAAPASPSQLRLGQQSESPEENSRLSAPSADGDDRAITVANARTVRQSLYELRSRLETRHGAVLGSDKQPGSPSSEDSNLSDELQQSRLPPTSQKSVTGHVEHASDRQAILSMLEKLVPPAFGASRQPSAAGRPISAPRSTATNVATTEEWTALLLDAARAGNIEDIGLTLDIMQVSWKRLTGRLKAADFFEQRAGATVTEKTVQAAIAALPRANALDLISPLLEKLATGTLSEALLSKYSLISESACYSQSCAISRDAAPSYTHYSIQFRTSSLGAFRRELPSHSRRVVYSRFTKIIRTGSLCALQEPTRPLHRSSASLEPVRARSTRRSSNPERGDVQLDDLRLLPGRQDRP